MEVLRHLEAHAAQLAVFVASFTIVSLVEMLRPRRATTGETGWRWLNNLLLALVAVTCTRPFRALVLLVSAWWAGAHGMGLLQLWQPGWVFAVIVTLLVLDGANYAIHRAFHRWPLLWRMHMVHHSDTEFDVTTAYRNHPLASLLVLAIRLPIVLALGAPVAAVALYELLTVVIDFFSHGNARISARADALLRRLIVTPDFHRAHHRSDQRFTDSNYATLFPVFDHLFGTASTMSYAEHEQVELGLQHHRQRRDHRIDQLLLLPFRALLPPTQQLAGEVQSAEDRDVAGEVSRG